MAKLPLFPKNPERVCWGCDKYCPAESLACGNGTIRTQHPIELFGEDWLVFEAGKGSALNDSSAGKSASEAACELATYDDFGYANTA